MRARGANARLGHAFEGTAGVRPAADSYTRMAFVSTDVGAEQPLEPDDLLGYGRARLQPDLGRVTAAGNVVFPVDVRLIGRVLKMLLGNPTSVDSVAAQGVIEFSAKPAANSTIVLNGTTWTFVTTSPTGNQIQIGADLAATLTAAAAALGASAETQTAKCTYAVDGSKLTITYKTLGLGGNAYTLAIGGTINAKIVGEAATLTGGARTHTFVDSAQTLPTSTFIVANPDVPAYFAHNYYVANTMAISMATSGKLNATVGFIGQDEKAVTAADMGTLIEAEVLRFTQFSGEILINGASVGSLVAAEMTYNNGAEGVEVIRPDGLVEGVDIGQVSYSGSITARFANMNLYNLATGQVAVELRKRWSRGRGQALEIKAEAVRLPRAKKPITGPGGIQSQFNWEAAINAATGRMVTFALTNDVADYN